MSYGKVHEEYWDGEKIKPLSDRAALLGLYLITGPHRNAIGCFRLGRGAISDVPRFGEWGFEGVSKALMEMVETGFIARDEATGWTLIPNALVKDPVNSPNAARHAVALAAKVPANTLVYNKLFEILSPQLEAYSKALKSTLGYPLEAPSKDLRTPLPSPEPSPLPEPEDSAPNGAARDFENSDQQSQPAESKKQNGSGSDEEKFWAAATELEEKGVTRSRCGQLANLLNGDFEEGVEVLKDVAGAKQPSKYLGAIIRNRKAEQRPAARGDTDVPAWVGNARAEGYEVEREGERWRMAGALYDDAGEQVGC